MIKPSKNMLKSKIMFTFKQRNCEQPIHNKNTSVQQFCRHAPPCITCVSISWTTGMKQVESWNNPNREPDIGMHERIQWDMHHLPNGSSTSIFTTWSCTVCYFTLRFLCVRVTWCSKASRTEFQESDTLLFTHTPCSKIRTRKRINVS